MANVQLLSGARSAACTLRHDALTSFARKYSLLESRGKPVPMRLPPFCPHAFQATFTVKAIRSF
jgi:hypothetical protein